MAIQWHPLLAQFLRQDYGDRLEIHEQVNLGKMPLRADLVLIRRDPTVSLPYPFNHLGATTLVEYKGPDEAAGQQSLNQLEIYALLYGQKVSFRRRSELTLWLVASKFARHVSQRDGAYLAHARRVGPGVRSGSLDRFPTCFVDLNELPVNSSTLPLVMVSWGRQERALVEYLVDHRHEHSHYGRFLFELHQGIFEEVFLMRRLTMEEMGVEDPDEFITSLMKWAGEERALKLVTQLLGEERILRGLVKREGAEQVLRELVNQLGTTRFRRLTEKLAKESAKKSG
jgi:hypothetical protein